ncbi:MULTISPECIES: (2Fe-2S)-binding protein [unclassified Tardiphaga]|uniref:(2Fe-2S)-binding protein n=1 Tax=unclassified Tardiphaga TaxID=2631404 RepID=UPI001FEEA8BC|nr:MULTISPECIES: 2Fe-2S iron-sulfur cluster-binding protein [unclassified Tardiphaga]
MANSAERTWVFNVNGAAVTVTAAEDLSLLLALRQDLDLKGTRVGCAQGNCGACTVLLDGQPIQSCTTPLYTVANRNVVTIEGLTRNGAPGALQRNFLDEQAAQCGYCINGIIMTVTGLLGRTPPANRREIVETLDERHLCRCGAQGRILRAIDRAIAGTPGTAS